MIPGRFHGETGAVIGIKPGQVRQIPLRVDGRAGDRWYLPTQDTSFSAEVSSIVLPAIRPTRLIFDVVRKDGDRTNRCTRTIPATGDPVWADVFGFVGWEYVNPDEGLFWFTLQHDGPQQVNVGKIVIDAVNPRAQSIHDDGGFNRWSDGEIR